MLGLPRSRNSAQPMLPLLPWWYITCPYGPCASALATTTLRLKLPTSPRRSPCGTSITACSCTSGASSSSVVPSIRGDRALLGIDLELPAEIRRVRVAAEIVEVRRRQEHAITDAPRHVILHRDAARSGGRRRRELAPRPPERRAVELEPSALGDDRGRTIDVEIGEARQRDRCGDVRGDRLGRRADRQRREVRVSAELSVHVTGVRSTCIGDRERRIGRDDDEPDRE